ncbi:MAG: acyl-CoA dehydrogenase family protein [Hydrogenovibrio sp.]|uniref:acyl-CoA dehydrogenase family protein n=1 Tax=Hydrogenovibrio sp. TaxID=2065821 RepID=UPI00287045A2|nr:acyl-CoA dehydrogenase family protein [Hydrogenovibrio sp.]MDR9498203.1 acyl-CoA dehydrogenase family protein [Hydrogenovibrio sp.]
MIRQIVEQDLKPLTVKIDHGLYTTEVMGKIGKAGGFRHHIGSQNNGDIDLFGTIKDMATVSEECMSTGFMMWTQAVCTWYIENSDNEWLKSDVLPKMVDGDCFGATALSNPMKYLAGIEELKLSATETADGFIINGTLPWVSNLEPGSGQHFFGSIFSVHHKDGQRDRDVMALIPCDLEGLALKQMAEFVGMEGTGTYSLVFDNAFLPKKYLLADPLLPYLKRIKAGFILLQTGMAAGVIQGAINDMNKSNLTLSDINEYLDEPPEDLQEDLDDALQMIESLCADPFNSDEEFLRSVLEARLLGAELCKRAADSVMQHAGAKGYLMDATAQRKMREAYFVIIVTPSIKHLRKEISRLEAA